MENLTKENFWDNLKERFPEAVEVFCKWIDEYKKENKWEHLFLPVYVPGSAFKSAPKYHDLPYHYQMGIWFEFVSFWACSYPIDIVEYDLRQDIIGFMENILQPQINKEKEAEIESN